VSRSNDCPFCVEAHTLLCEVAGGAKERGASIGRGRDRAGERRTRELLAWAAATREPSSELLRDPPFSAREAPEAIGTAFAFHYVNRMVEVFQGHGGMSVGPRPLRPIALRLVAKLAGRPLRRRREPGRTLDLLPAAELPPELGWARPAPAIAAALARFSAVVEQAGAGALTVSEREHVSAALGGWGGADPPLGAGWLERALVGLEPSAQAPTRLALLAALAPYRVDDAAVEAFGRARPGDSELIGAVAWSSLAATRRITSWLAPQSLLTR
jgi:AhpD family alkylhydroperoxidase